MAKAAWRAVHLDFNILPPNSMASPWLQGVDNNLRSVILVGAAAVFWPVWLCCNDTVFYRKKGHSCMQENDLPYAVVTVLRDTCSCSEATVARINWVG
ncbi:hypothetical protein BRADI_3g19823v3 [Brachypodium distachyon]|uniref:Uncharacterized protein n=1 Tax=Brachypodium distachyon TaxID=15368 RepID=A0A2K2CYE3_BRADI|nr:hypothetical protein BRADI_3g19823v3 [Brachypodium distachyon]